MSGKAEIINLLNEKNGKFLEYEEATLQLLKSNADTAENYIIRRDELANEIDELTAKIGYLCDNEANSDLLTMVAASKKNYEDVPEDMIDIFNAASNFRSTASRIKGMEQQVINHLERLKKDAVSKLKEKQNVPKIKKYLNDLSDKNESIGLKNDKA